MVIKVEKSPNADSQTADPAAEKGELLRSTKSHIDDVSNGLYFIAELIKDRAGSYGHDRTKINNFD